MKRLALTLALMSGFVLGGVVIANDADAQERRGRNLSRPTETRDTSGEVIKDKGGKALSMEERKARGMADAAGIVQRAGLTCTVSDAIYNGAGRTAGDDGKPIEVQTYEIACQQGLGYLLEDRTTEVRAFDCIVAKAAADRAAAAATDPKAAKPPVCVLPGNADLNAALQPLVAQGGARCTVTNVSYIGFSPSNKIQRYEVACSEGMGYILDRPDAGSTATLSVNDCLAAEAGGYDCALTPKAARVAYITSIAGRSDRPCTVADARYMGKAGESQFFEVACNGAQGFVMETKAGAVVRAIDCIEAQGIGEGCKLSSTQAALEQREQQYLARLRASGVVCDGDEFRLIGKDSRDNRDVVEFRCANRPAGLVAFVPAAASGNVTSFDCIEAEGRAIKCQLTTRETIIQVLNRVMASKECTVTNYAVLGASATDGEVLEVACAGDKTGYIVDLPTSRTAFTKTLSCQQSASRGGDRCRLPENQG